MSNRIDHGYMRATRNNTRKTAARLQPATDQGHTGASMYGLSNSYLSAFRSRVVGLALTKTT